VVTHAQAGRDAGDLVSMPVIATHEGRNLGRVKDVLFDTTEHAVLGLIIERRRNDRALFLPRACIRSIGHDALTVSDTEELAAPEADPRAFQVMQSGIHIKGTPVVTESGEAIGKVERILLTRDCGVAAYVTSHGPLGFGGKEEVRPEDVISIGRDVMVVRHRPGPPDLSGDGDHDRFR
jgi:uncharacterized protein YrrD